MHLTSATHAVCTVIVLLTLTQGHVLSQEVPMAPESASVPVSVRRFTCVPALRSNPIFKAGGWVETAGFHTPGDGGAALYQIRPRSDTAEPNGADRIAVAGNGVAVLVEGEAVNYRMFGAIGDGTNDDGVQIKRAHGYAREQGLPVVNLSGEFWIRETNSIPLATNTHWGGTVFHIDERFNSRRHPRFIVPNDEPAIPLELTEELKSALLEQVRPGVQIIPALADYAGHLIIVTDTEDRIGIRAGNYSKRGWAREDLFYVEEEGRVIGDIAWTFSDLTSVRAIPCNTSYRIIEGGGFFFSGDTPESGSKGYHHHGIAIRRSRTIVREQWMGLEQGRRDVSMEPRCGFYVLNNVYDVTLENIRAMPWEKNRREKGKVVAHGTYGIGGARMLNCTFRNLTAEGGWVAWGVFGTNLNKNFRIENCRLNRVDVHFHCWNLRIVDSEIGFKGISLTGGGDLIVENTVRHGNSFIHFRPDYGSKWDGDIRLRGCTLKPTGNSGTYVLGYRILDFDHQYPVGYARSIVVEDMVIDYSAAPANRAPCWVMDTVPFSRNSAGTRLFFPRQLIFRDIRVQGRDKGVRLLRLPDPHHYDLDADGGFDDDLLTPNCSIVCDSVDLEAVTADTPADPRAAHLVIGAAGKAEYTDARALYPSVLFRDCRDVGVYLGNCAASVAFERCTINTVTARSLGGEILFDSCRLRPNVSRKANPFYTLEAVMGTRFSNCTIHAPVVGGRHDPAAIDQSGILTLNGAVQHTHTNTALSNRILQHCRDEGIALSPEFTARLQLHSSPGD